MKYKYVYEIRTNNLCWGNKLLETCDTLKKARFNIYNYTDKYGCCDIYKRREYIGE